MATSDYIAFGILIFCMCLGLFGLLKWLLRVVAGAALGVLILACLSFMAEDPQFNTISRGVFRQGVVFPCMRSHICSLHEFRDDDTLVSTENKDRQDGG